MDIPDLPPVEDGFLESPHGWPLIRAEVAALIAHWGGLTALALLRVLPHEARRALADSILMLERIALRLLFIEAAPRVAAFVYAPYAPHAAESYRAPPRWSEDPARWRVIMAMPAFKGGGGKERDHGGRAKNFESAGAGARTLAYRLEALRRLGENPERAIAALARKLAAMRLAPQSFLHAPLPKRLAPQSYRLERSHIQAYRALKAMGDRLLGRRNTS